jgi:signal transduction histidine kinase/integral membrane sensor domain MASE1
MGWNWGAWTWRNWNWRNWTWRNWSWGQFSVALWGLSGPALAVFIPALLTARLLNFGLEPFPLWPPSGIALALMLCQGPITGWGIWLGLTLFGLFLGAALPVAAIAGTGSTLSAYLGYRWLRRKHFANRFDTLRDSLLFLSLGVGASPLPSAIISSLVGSLAGIDPWTKFSYTLWIHWLGDSMGILVLASGLLALMPQMQTRSWAKFWGAGTLMLRPQRIKAVLLGGIEPIAVMACLGLIGLWVFLAPQYRFYVNYPLDLLPFPVVVWAALRLGPSYTLLCSLVVCCFALGGVWAQVGPFISKSHGYVPQAIVMGQLFVGCLTTTALVITGLVGDRTQAERQLRQRLEAEQVLSEITLKINRSLDIQEIAQATTAALLQFFQADRVSLGYSEFEGPGLTLAEAKLPHIVSMHEVDIPPEVVQMLLSRYQEPAPRVRVNPNAWASPMPPPLAEFFQQSQIQAALSVVLHLGEHHWGLLGVHMCSSLRQWTDLDVELLDRLGIQLEIALQKTRLYDQVTQLAQGLEIEVEERTAQIQAQVLELERSNRTKDLLLHAISHDLKTPLQGMVMLLERLQTKARAQLSDSVDGTVNGTRPDAASPPIPPIPPNPTVALPLSVLEQVLGSAHHQLRLLGCLMEDELPGTLRTQLNWQATTPGAITQLAIGSKKWGPEAATALEQAFDANPGVRHLPLSADARQLAYLLEQFLTNAIAHNRPPVEVQISWDLLTQQQLAERDRRDLGNVLGDGLVHDLEHDLETGSDLSMLQPLYVCCTVKDAGKGIDPSQCDRLFELYPRGLDNHHRTGIGLGLYQCRQIIQAHGGKIGVSSQLGQGSQFWFSLPVANLPGSSLGLR